MDPLGSAAAWSRRLAIAVIALAAGLTLVAPTVAAPVAMALAVIGFVAGVPHGAVDHLVTRRLVGQAPMALVILVYAGLACAMWVLLRWGGPAVLLAVVALSAVHFGLGELEVSRLLTGWWPGPVVATAIVIAGCGALMLPLARSGDQLETVAAAISPDLARAIGAAPVQVGLAAVWLAAAAVAITAALKSRHRSVAVDTAIIGALGLLAPPLVAFAAWFGGWHAVRHTARMLTVEPDCARLLAAGRPRMAVLRLARLAALPSAAALLVVAGLVWLAASAPDSTVVVAEVLQVLLALTVPHMVVVFWLDRHADRSRRLPA